MMAAHPQSSPSWHPLFAGEEAEPYLTVVHDLADFFQAPPHEWRLPEPSQWSWVDEPRSPRCYGLANGVAGIALFLAYYHQAFGGEDVKNAAISLLEEEFARLQHGLDNLSYFGGLAGIAWTTQHLQSRVFNDPDDLLEEADAALLRFVSAAGDQIPYDIISGWVGLGVYFLERLPRPSAADGLTAVINHLARIAETSDDGAAWLTSPELLNESQRRASPNGHYNLGVAHGNPGVIGFLGRAAAWDGAPAGTQELFTRAADWLWKQCGPKADPSRLPLWVNAGDQPADQRPADGRSSRQAWCYGDAGVSLAIYSAATVAGAGDHAGRAVELAAQSLSVNPDHTGVVDPGLCHGATGLAHIENRFYQATGRQEFADVARYWYARSLQMRWDGEGILGFKDFDVSSIRKSRWQTTPGVLTGAAGIGLALLGATVPFAPAWDRFLLLDIEGRHDSF